MSPSLAGPSSRTPKRRLLALLLHAGAILALRAPGRADGIGLRAPEGFEVSLHAGDDLAHDIFSMTIDAEGRVVVAGKGYIKTLHDDDGDGRADRASLFADWPKQGARGMYFDGETLLCSGDAGLYRLHDRDGDGRADGAHELLFPAQKPGEHAANGIVKGPDGWIYWIGGNDAGFGEAHAGLPGSPVKRPSCGALVRVSPDGRSSEVLADGFRNPYDLDFNSFGAVFTYEADGERDQYLPWYSPTRVFDIALGMHHGWLLRGWQHSWNRPECFLDNVERLAEIGRGSPTGVAVYRHHRFPERYRDGLFIACWSLGRVYFLPLERAGASYRASPEIFLETTGDAGFAPVDLAVGPEGDLFVAIGGRGTRGSVFTVRHRVPPAEDARDGDPLRRVLAAPQPLASWSRARWVPEAKRLGKAAFESAIDDGSLPLAERLRALEVLVEVFGGPGAAAAKKTLASPDPELAARAVWALSRSTHAQAYAQAAVIAIAPLTRHGDPRVERAAWEALASIEADPVSVPDWRRGLAHRDRRVRSAAAVAARGAGRRSFEASLPPLEELREPWELIGALRVLGPERPDLPDWPAVFFDACRRAHLDARDPQVRLDAVRLMQLGLGDIALDQDKPAVADGFRARDAARVGAALRERAAAELRGRFPSGHRDLDRETARLLALLDVDASAALARIAPLWTEASAVEDDIHYLLAAARIAGPRSAGFSTRCAHALCGLHDKMRRSGYERSRFWSTWVGGAFEELLRLDPGLAVWMVAEPAFGLVEHADFAARLPAGSTERKVAPRRMLARARAEGPAYALTAEAVESFAALDDAAARSFLRERWQEPSLRGAIVRALARRPEEADRGRFVEALALADEEAVAAALNALHALPAPSPADPDALRAALEALDRFSAFKERAAARYLIVRLLIRWTGVDVPVVEGPDLRASYKPYFDWFRRAYPEAAAELALGGGDWESWRERLAKVDWERGDASRGRAVFAARSCESCHGSSSRLGPDLRGAAGRFSREDLFRAIVEPSRDVSPAFASKLVLTRSGRAYRGVLIYDSPAVTLLQVSADVAARFGPGEIVETRDTEDSFMPAGLADGLKDGELADLYAYLKTLR